MVGDFEGIFFFGLFYNFLDLTDLLELLLFSFNFILLPDFDDFFERVDLVRDWLEGREIDLLDLRRDEKGDFDFLLFLPFDLLLDLLFDVDFDGDFYALRPLGFFKIFFYFLIDEVLLAVAIFLTESFTLSNKICSSLRRFRSFSAA